jgi:hypothetical protein
MAGKSKGKGKRLAYEAVMTTDPPVSSDFVDYYANAGSRSDSSLVVSFLPCIPSLRLVENNFPLPQSTPEASELESVSSTASRDLSISPQTPLSHIPETHIEVVNHDTRQSAVDSMLDNYTTAQSQLFYYDVSPSISFSPSHVDWTSVQCSGVATVDQPLDGPWEKIASTSYEPNFTERLGDWNQSPGDAYVLTTSPLPLIISSGDHQRDFLRHNLYHTHSHPLLHDYHQVEQQSDQQYYHGVGLVHGQNYSDSHASLQVPSYLAPSRCNGSQTAVASFSPVLSS